MKNYSLTAVILFIILLCVICMTSCSKGYGCYYSATHSIEIKKDQTYFQSTNYTSETACEIGEIMTAN